MGEMLVCFTTEPVCFPEAVESVEPYLRHRSLGRKRDYFDFVKVGKPLHLSTILLLSFQFAPARILADNDGAFHVALHHIHYVHVMSSGSWNRALSSKLISYIIFTTALSVMYFHHGDPFA